MLFDAGRERFVVFFAFFLQWRTSKAEDVQNSHSRVRTTTRGVLSRCKEQQSQIMQEDISIIPFVIPGRDDFSLLDDCASRVSEVQGGDLQLDIGNQTQTAVTNKWARDYPADQASGTQQTGWGGSESPQAICTVDVHVCTYIRSGSRIPVSTTGRNRAENSQRLT